MARSTVSAGDDVKNTLRGTPSHEISLDQAVPNDPARRASGVQARAARSEPSAPPSRAASSQAALISLGSPPKIELLEPTYAYLSTYCAACLEPRLAERLNVAIYELYANALRYGSAGGAVRLELHQLDGGMRLTVSNSAESTHRERLLAQAARVKHDPSAAFSGEMNRFSSGSQPPPMLGIVRIAHESALPLELQIEGERVTLSVECG